MRGEVHTGLALQKKKGFMAQLYHILIQTVLSKTIPHLKMHQYI